MTEWEAAVAWLERNYDVQLRLKRRDWEHQSQPATYFFAAGREVSNSPGLMFQIKPDG